MLALFRMFLGVLGTAIIASSLDEAKSKLKGFLWKYRKILAIRSVKKLLGLPTPSFFDMDYWQIDAGDDFSFDEQEVTAAINQKCGIKDKLGIEFTNIFNREAIKEDLNKLGLARINEILGASADNPVIESFNPASLRANLRGYMGNQAMQAVSTGSSFLIDGAGAQRIVTAAMTFERNYENYKPEQKRDLIMTQAAISNRERQARYRENHARHWEPK